MITNPGFSFTGLSGKHEIIPTTDTDLQIWGVGYEKTIRCYETGDLVQVYKNGPGHNYLDSSPAMEFIAISLDDEAAMIAFCDKYGMTSSQRQEANFRNNYIFSDIDKNTYSKNAPFGRVQEIMWVGELKREISSMRLLVDLNEAIEKNNAVRIIEILTFFCFDLNRLCFEGAHWPTETSRFNHLFHLHANSEGYDMQHGMGSLLFNDLIESFLEQIETSCKIEQQYALHGQPYHHPYIEVHHSMMWQHIISIFEWLLPRISIESISPYGEVVFNPDIQSVDINPLLKEDNHFMNTAKSLLVDIFRERLHRVSPELQFNHGTFPETSWKIPSLVEAMYMELFFRLTPTGTIRKCANPTCPNYFQWSASRKTRKYCCSSCAELMAKRMERERKRKSN